MKKIMFNLFISILILQLSTGCKEDETNTVGDQSPTKGYAIGKVSDTQGNPLKGAEIVLDNTYLYNSDLLGTTDADGKYRIKLSFGTYNAYAYYKKNYNGKDYKFDLHPDTDDGFAQDGAVRNFEWRLTGKKPGTESYYGGTVEIMKEIGSEIYDPENIEFTLTPIGKLIDGSTVEKLVIKTGLPTTDTYSKLVDIPIGKYKITAIYKGESGDVPIKMKNFLTQQNSFTTSLEIDFEPKTSSCFNCALIIYSE